MKLSKLQAIKELDSLSNLTPLQQNKKTLLSNIELISYTIKLCLFSTRIIRGEIEVSKRNEVLVMVDAEVQKLTHLISSGNIQNNTYTHKDSKVFYKKVGLKPKHTEN